MIATIDAPEVEVNSNATPASFGIDVEDMPHVLDILRNKMYSSKPLAVLREYCANSADAHVEAGIPERPIEVYLPNDFDPIFKVRDFGLGLSRQDVENVYVKYGKSTRRNSNAFIGALGFGSKAGFSLSDQFTVTSWHGGFKSVYSCFIDPSRMGKIVLLNQSISSEPNGIEVAVPIQEKDFTSFKSNAQSLFRYWTPQPIIHGCDDFNDYQTPEEIFFEGAGWKIANTIESFAIMGNAPYPIDSSNFEGPMYNLVRAGLGGLVRKRERLDDKMSKGARIKGSPAHLPALEYEKGEFDRLVKGRPCRKLKLSMFAKEALVEYEDGTKEVVKIGVLRRKPI